MLFRADLHIHSVLSPCGSLEMSPRDIVRTASEKGVHVIAVTDHNTCAHAPYIEKLSAEYGITAFYGMELQTISETHALCLFGSVEDALHFGDQIYALVPDVPNNAEVFGDQVEVDENGMIVREETKMLLQSAEIEIEEAIDMAHAANGLLFAAHIDRDTFSIISQLGFIREGLPLDGIEFSKHTSYAKGCALFSDYCKSYPVLRNSDAHFLEDIGAAYTILDMQAPTFNEFKKALIGENGRSIRYDA